MNVDDGYEKWDTLYFSYIKNAFKQKKKKSIA